MSEAPQNSPGADASDAEKPTDTRTGGDVSTKGAVPKGGTQSDRDYGGIAIDPPDNSGGGSNW